MKNHFKKYLLLYVYLLIMLLLEIIFWSGIDKCGLEIGILSYYLIFPISTFVISIIFGHRIKNWKKYLLILFFGISVTLFEYTTSSLSNMIAFHKINMPSFSPILIYGFISIIGIIIGGFLNIKKYK